jgi:hypothetical protein
VSVLPSTIRCIRIDPAGVAIFRTGSESADHQEGQQRGNLLVVVARFLTIIIRKKSYVVSVAGCRCGSNEQDVPSVLSSRVQPLAVSCVVKTNKTRAVLMINGGFEDNANNMKIKGLFDCTQNTGMRYTFVLRANNLLSHLDTFEVEQSV